jgi:hypothetical protein
MHPPYDKRRYNMSLAVQVFVFLLGATGYLLSPIILIWGWVRWLREPKVRNLPALLSLVGFILSTASAVLAVSAAIYSLATGGFRYWDPRLIKIMGVGALLSFGGFVLAIGGIWRANSLRWHAPVSSVATFAFWLLAAALE